MKVPTFPKWLFHHFIDASLYGGDTLFPMLSALERELSASDDFAAATAITGRVKPQLEQRLRARIGSPAASQALTLKVLNLYLARQHFRARSSFLTSRPIGLVVDPSNVCTLACPGCVHSAHSEALRLFNWPKGTLSEDRLASLLRIYGPHAIGIYFCNYGEPLLNLNTPKLIRLAKCYLLWASLSTSLSVRRFDPEAYVKSGLDLMILSIDGATQPVYERFRRNGNLGLVLENVRQLVHAKRRLKKRTPVLSWNFLAFEHNVHEIPLAERMARDLGLDQFRVVHPFDVTWDDPQIRPAAVKPRVELLNWHAASNLPENWNPFPSDLDADAIGRAFADPWKPGVPAVRSSGHTCHWLYKNMVMDANGRIMPCCGAPRPDTNLVFAEFDGSQTDPFNSEKYRQARSFFAGAAPPAAGAPHCVNCEWDQTLVNIGSDEISRYLRAADPAFFDRRTVRLLSEW